MRLTALMRLTARVAAACLAIIGSDAAFATPPAASQATAAPRIVVAFANPVHSAPGTAASTGNRYSGGGYSVGQSALRQAHRVATAYGLHEVVSWPIQLLSMHCVVFEISDGRSVPQVLAALSKDSSVVLAQPLQEFHTLTDHEAPAADTDASAADASPANAPYNDPLYDLQTNLTALGIARAHQRAQGAGVRIALIDTGVDASHPELAGRLARRQSFLLSPASSGSTLRHGTAMAGVMAAVANNHIGIVGIAPLAQIEVYEACWQAAPASDAAMCNTFTLARALAAALASGAPLVNLSLGGPADALLTALVQAGLKRGVTFVGATASDSPFPTAIPGVITAAGSEQPLPPGALGAPAQHVMTLRPGGEYDFESGSSVAAAEITGVIALLMSVAAKRPTTEAIVSALRGGSAGHAAGPVDVNAAMAQLDTGRGGASVAARASP
jgi:subtilisin family serine protease